MLLGQLHRVVAGLTLESIMRSKVGLQLEQVSVDPHLAQFSTWHLMQVLEMVLRVNSLSHLEHTPVNWLQLSVSQLSGHLA